MHDTIFVIYAVLALILLLIASPPHFKSGNVGACTLVVWCFIGTLGFLVNAIVWWDNIENKAPIWCDICESDPSSSSTSELLPSSARSLTSAVLPFVV